MVLFSFCRTCSFRVFCLLGFVLFCFTCYALSANFKVPIVDKIFILYPFYFVSLNMAAIEKIECVYFSMCVPPVSASYVFPTP